MSDLDVLRQLQQADMRLRQTEAKEVPPLYLPWTQRYVNPHTLANSGFAWGDMGQPWAVQVLAWYCSVFVLTTNDGANFWTIQLQDTNAVALASFTTAAIAANTWSRFSVTGVTQPGASNGALVIVPTATLAPGAIFIVPAVALLRTGN